VSQHPEVEAKIVAELDSLGLLATAAQPQPRQLQYEDLSKLTYLNMVIKARRPPLPSRSFLDRTYLEKDVAVNSSHGNAAQVLRAPVGVPACTCGVLGRHCGLSGGAEDWWEAAWSVRTHAR
jgi:hypothetical protein